MTKFQKVLGLAVAGIVVGLLFLAVRRPAEVKVDVPQTNSSYAGVYSQSQQNFENGGLKIGPFGSVLQQAITGTCTPTATTTTVAATSTVQLMCSVTGVQSGDKVFIALPIGAGRNALGSGSGSLGFSVAGTYATTSDVIGFSIQNGTGAATSSYIQAITNIQYWVTR